jgi:hypothetical protein
MIDSLVQPAWVGQLIDDIAESSVARVVLLIRNASLAPQVPNSLFDRMKRVYSNRKYLLFAAYSRFDNRRHNAHNSAFANVDLTSRLADVPALEVVPRETRFCDYFPDEALAAIRAFDLDVAIRLGFRILRGDVLNVARFGVWSYHHGDNLVNRGGPPGFWEVFEAENTTGSVLQILSEQLDAGRVIYRSAAATQRFSVAANREGYFWKSSEFVLRKLRDVSECGHHALTNPTRPVDEPAAYSRRLYTIPTNREFIPRLTRRAGDYAVAKIRAATSFEQWFLAYRFDPLHTCSDVPDLAPFRFRNIVPPADRFWADPFPLHHDGKYYVLFEEVEFARPKGRIRVLELGQRGPVGDAVTVLERNYHLSYPFVFRHEGQLYMVPESASNRTVELYRAVRGPYEWELDRILLEDVALTDATILEINGRWWMFAGSVARGGSRVDELSLYCADSLFGPWRRHRRNPVVSDVRRARPAGRPFHIAGQWYRPAQDCSRRYGYAIRIQRIVRLDDDGFEEETVSILTPDWSAKLLATHTINRTGELTVLDALRRRWRGFYNHR